MNKKMLLIVVAVLVLLCGCDPSSVRVVGTRTLMMNEGEIVFDTEGKERSSLTVDDLLKIFKENVGKRLDNDRVLQS